MLFAQRGGGGDADATVPPAATLGDSAHRRPNDAQALRNCRRRILDALHDDGASDFSHITAAAREATGCSWAGVSFVDYAKSRLYIAIEEDGSGDCSGAPHGRQGTWELPFQGKPPELFFCAVCVEAADGAAAAASLFLPSSSPPPSLPPAVVLSSPRSPPPKPRGPPPQARAKTSWRWLTRRATCASPATRASAATPSCGTTAAPPSRRRGASPSVRRRRRVVQVQPLSSPAFSSSPQPALSLLRRRLFSPRAGTVCVMDKAPRVLSASQRRVLSHLAGLVTQQLELRLRAITLQQARRRRGSGVVPPWRLFFSSTGALLLLLAFVPAGELNARRLDQAARRPDGLPQVRLHRLRQPRGAAGGGRHPARFYRLEFVRRSPE